MRLQPIAHRGEIAGIDLNVAEGSDIPAACKALQVLAQHLGIQVVVQVIPRAPVECRLLRGTRAHGAGDLFGAGSQQIRDVLPANEEQFGQHSVRGRFFQVDIGGKHALLHLIMDAVPAVIPGIHGSTVCIAQQANEGIGMHRFIRRSKAGRSADAKALPEHAPTARHTGISNGRNIMHILEAIHAAADHDTLGIFLHPEHKRTLCQGEDSFVLLHAAGNRAQRHAINRRISPGQRDTAKVDIETAVPVKLKGHGCSSCTVLFFVAQTPLLVNTQMRRMTKRQPVVAPTAALIWLNTYICVIIMPVSRKRKPKLNAENIFT